jgi:hypothetical protein
MIPTERATLFFSRIRGHANEVPTTFTTLSRPPHRKGRKYAQPNKNPMLGAPTARKIN